MTAIRNVPGVERPLTARSVMASLLLGMHPPRMRASQLVRWCGLFGIAEGTARVALHRMAARGEIAAGDGTYELAGALAQRQRAQDWSLDPRPTPWSGEWRLGVVAADARPAPDRQRLRDAMRRLRFAQLREGVWLRPDNLPASAAPDDAARAAGEQCRWFRARPDPGLDVDLESGIDSGIDALVALFAPEEWAAHAHDLADELTETIEALTTDPDEVLADAFVLGASVLGHVRADPLLPPPLLPEPWPGARLRDAYRRYQRTFATSAAEWFAR